MTACLPAVVDICRHCRTHVSWPVTGVTEADVAQVYLDGSDTAIPLALAPDAKTVIGYFAGPDYVTPGAATVVTRTVHAQIRIVTPTETLHFDGGFVRIVH